MGNLRRTAKFLSLILRHDPGAAGVTLDKNGWVEVPVLLEGLSSHGHPITLDDLVSIVVSDEKGRYAMTEDRSKIRANQGHSVGVDLGLVPVMPPPFLYHGTGEQSVDVIRADGLKKMSRDHVHLSYDVGTALKVGKRHGKPVVLVVRAGDHHAEGGVYYQSENGVWLTESVPVKYLENPSSEAAE